MVFYFYSKNDYYVAKVEPLSEDGFNKLKDAMCKAQV